MKLRAALSAALVLCGAVALAPSAPAFPHTLSKGETLASLSKRYYGTPQFERVLSTVNALDRGGPRALAPGMILEIPAHSYVRVAPGDTWQSLAEVHLGHPERATTLAQQNDSEPWLTPEIGRVIRLPYNLSWVLSGDESLATLAYRFMGSTKRAYELAVYNQLKDGKLKAGQVLLIPLKDLTLTSEGESAAARGCQPEAALRDEQALRAQAQAQAELAELYLDVRAGRYTRALTRAAELRALGNLPKPKQVELLVLELEAQVAFDAVGPARSTCETLRELAPDYRFDPIETSPKILDACPAKDEPKNP